MIDAQYYVGSFGGNANLVCCDILVGETKYRKTLAKCETYDQAKQIVDNFNVAYKQAVWDDQIKEIANDICTKFF